MRKHRPITTVLISIWILLGLAHLDKAYACQQLSAKALKAFKDKTGVDLNQSITLQLSSQMTPPKENAVQWDRQQKKKWQILLPTTKIEEVKATDYRIFACSGNMIAYYPCTKTLYQLRLQLNPKESCNSLQSDRMNIAVLASAENNNLRVLDFLFESNPNSHQLTPLGMLVLEDMELSKKEITKIGSN